MGFSAEKIEIIEAPTTEDHLMNDINSDFEENVALVFV